MGGQAPLRMLAQPVLELAVGLGAGRRRPLLDVGNEAHSRHRRNRGT